MTQNRSPLHRLADLVGIVPEYVDQTGTETRVTSDETRVAILGAMGIDASTAAGAGEALEALEAQRASRPFAPVRVVRGTDADASQLVLRTPQGSAGSVDWSLEFVPEEGEPYRIEGSARPEADGNVRLRLREPPAEGYHTLRVHVRAGGEEISGDQSLIVVPDHCTSVQEASGQSHVFGVIANLYSVRSAENWGVGDLSDLGRLLEWTAETGGTFVGVNPLHALRNRGMDISPYSPVSRVHRNAIYIDIAAVPELAESDEAKQWLAAGEVREELARLRQSRHVEYERIIGLKMHALEALHGAFRARHADGSTGRGREYRSYLDEHGDSLTLFGTFEALVEHLGAGNWREWPDAFRDPRTAEVARFRQEHRERIDLHCWIQFELDRQLGAAAARGERAGLAIGLYQDLAIGTSPIGSDVWSNPDLFVNGVSVGAPPDDYSAAGQNWGLPPLDPRMLREDAYRYWIRLVRASMRHGGALRIDHAIGLFRQFWIPQGMSGRQGAYVRLPADDLIGILALESRRHRAIVVGEDLGTVPPEVPPSLHGWGVLSSRVFYFEREGNRFRDASDYEPMALTTANTHDMPTLAGFWCGRDVEVKRRVGIIETDEAAAAQTRARDDERRAILELLAAAGVLPAPHEPASGAELRGAVHAFLCRTPSVMVGFNLDDLVGEVEPVNVPGVGLDRFSSWTRRLSTPVEALAASPEVGAALRCEGRKRG
jgi:4-alpha-glucanotransferase